MENGLLLWQPGLISQVVHRKQGWTELNGIIIIIIIIISFIFIVIVIIIVWRWAVRIRLRSVYFPANVVPVLPVVPERLLQDAWRFADPVCVWWQCSCRHGTTVDSLVFIHCTHLAFPYCVGVKLIEVQRVNRKRVEEETSEDLFQDYVRCHFKDAFMFHFHLSALHLCWKFCHVCTAMWYLKPGLVYREMLIVWCWQYVVSPCDSRSSTPLTLTVLKF